MNCLCRCVFAVTVACVLHLDGPAQDKGGKKKAGVPENIRFVLETGGHTAPVIQLAFRKNNKELVTVSTDLTIRFWDLQDDKLRQTLRPPMTNVEGAAFSRDGRLLALAGWAGRDDPVVLVVDLDTGAIVQDLPFPESNAKEFYAVAFSPNGKFLAAARDGGAVFWNLDKAGKGPRVIRLYKNVTALAFSPDGKHLATGVGRGDPAEVEVFDVPSLKLHATLKAGAAHALSWPKADALYVATQDGVRLWQIDKKKPQEKWDVGPTKALAPSPDATILATAGAGLKSEAGRVELLDAATGTRRLLLPDAKVNSVARAIAYAKDGSMFAACFGSHLAVQVFTAPAAKKGGQRLHKFAGTGEATRQAHFGSDGKVVTWQQGGKERTFHLEHLEFAKKPAAVGKFALGWLAFNGYYVRIQGEALLVEKQGGTGARYHRGDVTGIGLSPDSKYLVTGSLDQTLRIWRPDVGRPLLNLFVAGNEWIVWTNNGWYAASPGGESLMGWEVHEGRNQMCSFYPAQQFRKARYRPEMIAKLLEGGALKEAFQLAGGKKSVADEREQETLLPPEVRLDAPPEVKVASPKYKVVARASASNQAVEDLVLWLDDRPWQAPQKFVQGQDNSWDVTLQEGTHKLHVVARGKASTGVSRPISVTYVPEKIVPKAGPRLFVLAVGINNYQGYPKLKCAVNDAEVLAAVFAKHSQPLFADDVKVTVLKDKTATNTDIIRELDVLKEQTQPQDMIILFFAGHGMVEPKGDDRQFYFLSQNAVPGQLATTAVSGRDIKDRLVEVNARRVLLLLDACHSGAIGANGLSKDLADDDCGVAVICAAMGREVARERQGHGLFARAIIEGLSGKAAKNRGIVYLHHLEQYVIDRVQEDSDDQQHPSRAYPPSVNASAFGLARP